MTISKYLHKVHVKTFILAFFLLLAFIVASVSGTAHIALAKENKASGTSSAKAKDDRTPITAHDDAVNDDAVNDDAVNDDAAKNDTDDTDTDDTNAQNIIEEEDADINTINCREFLDSVPDEKDFLIIWLDGFMSASSESSIISKPWIAKLDRHIKNFCAKNTTKTLMDAIDAMPAGEL